MNNMEFKPSKRYLYRLTCHAQEQELCSLEVRTLLGQQPSWNESTLLIDSSTDLSVQRSPYMKYKIEIMICAASYEQLLDEVKALDIAVGYKVVVVEQFTLGKAQSIKYELRRKLEREIGMAIGGEVNLTEPELMLGVIQLDEHWVVGKYELHQGLWQERDRKPRHYSTALSTRVARAIVNIAVPSLDKNVSLIDPCCGIGTVLLEACDQGISAYGFDHNPLAVIGARENIDAFQYRCPVAIADMRKLEGRYDAAVLDLPYNHCSVLPESERREMLTALSRLARRAVIVSVEPIEHELMEIGAHILDAGKVSKTHFSRDIWLVSFE